MATRIVICVMPDILCKYYQESVQIFYVASKCMPGDDLSITWCRNDASWTDNIAATFKARNTVKPVISAA